MNSDNRKYAELGPKSLDFYSEKGSFKKYSSEKLHHHNFCQLLTIWNGVSVLETEVDKKFVYSNLAVFIPPYLAHRSTVVGDEVGYANIFFAKPLEGIIDSRITVFKMTPLFKELFISLCDKSIISPSEEIDNDMFSLLLKLLKTEIKNTPSHIILPVLKGGVSRMVTDYIHANYAQNITIDDIVSNIPYVKRHVYRLFKKETSLTISAYLKLYRMLIASVCLFDKSKSVIECAYSCGYNSITSFYKDFKSITGKSPGDFRKNL